MRKGLWDGFATCLASVKEAPEPLRHAMLAALPGDDQVRMLLLSPACKTLGQCSPATLLAVLDHEWVVVSGTEQLQPRAARAPFTHTLLVELTVILLYGRLKFDFVSHDVTGSAVMEFNAVMEPLYKDAARRLLNGIGGLTGALSITDRNPDPLDGEAPMRFRNAVREFGPVSQRVLALQHWSAVPGGQSRGFQRELAPAGMLVLTERELILISDEKTWSWLRVGRADKYGNVVTYCPLSRLENYRVLADDRLAQLELEIRAGGGGETVKVEFPPAQQRSIGDLM